jgi:hypothetical protein
MVGIQFLALSQATVVAQQELIMNLHLLVLQMEILVDQVVVEVQVMEQ